MDRQSQQACSFAQQALSPDVQVILQPSFVYSHLQIPQVRLHWKTLIPLQVYFNEQGWAKVELALARGKKKWDKRDAMAERDVRRQAERAMKDRAVR